jgi:hypothetical protein
MFWRVQIQQDVMSQSRKQHCQIINVNIISVAKEKGHFGDTSLDGIIIKWILKKYDMGA